MPASTDVIDLRTAEPGDVELIARLVRELAEYEHLEDRCRADAEVLRPMLFGPRPFAEVVLAQAGDEAAGFALFFHSFSTFECAPSLYLEDLFVRPAFRRRGIGRRLLAHLAKLAVRRRCRRMEWAALKWNEPALALYRGLGAREMQEWALFRLDGDALASLATAEAPAGQGGTA